MKRNRKKTFDLIAFSKKNIFYFKTYLILKHIWFYCFVKEYKLFRHSGSDERYFSGDAHRIFNQIDSVCKSTPTYLHLWCLFLKRNRKKNIFDFIWFVKEYKLYDERYFSGDAHRIFNQIDTVCKSKLVRDATVFFSVTRRSRSDAVHLLTGSLGDG